VHAEPEREPTTTTPLAPQKPVVYLFQAERRFHYFPFYYSRSMLGVEEGGALTHLVRVLFRPYYVG
jgi:hypothetical protein